MTTFNTDYNNAELLDQELTDDQLELVQGGVSAGTFIDIGLSFTPFGMPNAIAKLFGGSIGDLSDDIVDHYKG